MSGTRPGAAGTAPSQPRGVRGGLTRAVRRSWTAPGTAGRVVSLLLLPPSWLWTGVTRLRNVHHDRRPAPPVPGIRVISVGNLVVGGTGKTPLVAWVVSVLRTAGHRPAVVLRGYGRDEVLLHRRWHPDVPVHADPDRVAATSAARDAGADVAVVDDGFQHRRLARDLDVVLLAAEDPIPGPALPRGPYREPAASLARANVVVVTRRTADAQRAEEVASRVSRWTDAPVARAHLRSGRWLDLAGRPADPPKGPVVVAASVARPEAVAAAAARVLGPEADPVLLSFPDHHEYGPADVSLLEARTAGRTLVVTEKDAVKLEVFGGRLPHARVLTAEVVWEAGERELRARLLRASS